MRKIGMLGGTFNPPHLGHVMAAENAYHALGLEKVVFMPAGVPPHKPLPPESPPLEERLALTRLAADGLPWAEVSEHEVRTPGPSYTADTLAHLRGVYPDAELWLIVGDDMFVTMHQWKRPEEIFAACRVAVLCREPERELEIDWYKENLEVKFGAQASILQAKPFVISSTRLRRMIGQGIGSEYMSPAVWNHVLEQKLYGYRPNDGGKNVF